MTTPLVPPTRFFPTYLAFRPHDRHAETQSAFAHLPIRLIPYSIIDYVSVPYTAPGNTEQIDGIIITSARAIAHIPDLVARYRDHPVFVVGTFTAEQARARGFQNIRYTAPNAADLVLFLRNMKKGMFLFLRGDEVAHDFSGMPHQVLPIITYRSVPCKTLSKNILADLKKNKISGVLFFSAAHATHWKTLIDTQKPALPPGILSALCVSARVLESARHPMFKDLITAPTSDLAGMVVALQAYLDRT